MHKVGVTGGMGFIGRYVIEDRIGRVLVGPAGSFFA